MHCVSTGFMLICRDNACLFSAFVFRWTPPQRWSPTFNKKPSQVQLGKERNKLIVNYKLLIIFSIDKQPNNPIT